MGLKTQIFILRVGKVALYLGSEMQEKVIGCGVDEK